MKTSSKENPQTLIKLTEEAKKESKLSGLGFADSQKQGTKPLKKLRGAASLQSSQKKHCFLAAANKIRMCSRGKRERNKEGHAPFQVYFFHTYTNLHTLDINYTNCIQLFRERLSKRRVRSFATIPKGSMGDIQKINSTSSERCDDRPVKTYGSQVFG